MGGGEVRFRSTLQKRNAFVVSQWNIGDRFAAPYTTFKVSKTHALHRPQGPPSGHLNISTPAGPPALPSRWWRTLVSHRSERSRGTKHKSTTRSQRETSARAGGARIASAHAHMPHHHATPSSQVPSRGAARRHTRQCTTETPHAKSSSMSQSIQQRPGTMHSTLPCDRHGSSTPRGVGGGVTATGVLVLLRPQKFSKRVILAPAPTRGDTSDKKVPSCRTQNSM